VQFLVLLTVTLLVDPSPFPEITIVVPEEGEGLGVILGFGVLLGEAEGLTEGEGLVEGEGETEGVTDGDGVGKEAAAVKVLFKADALSVKRPKTF
jgi:hypothetical protein